MRKLEKAVLLFRGTEVDVVYRCWVWHNIEMFGFFAQSLNLWTLGAILAQSLSVSALGTDSLEASD